MTIDDIIKYILNSKDVNQLTFTVIDENGDQVQYNTANYLKYMYKSLEYKRAAVEEFMKKQTRDNDTEVIWSLERSLEKLDNYLKEYKEFDNYDSSDDETKQVLVKTIKLYSGLTVVFNSIVPVSHLDSVK